MNQGSEQPFILVADQDAEYRERVIPQALGCLDARVGTAKDVLEACRILGGQESKANGPPVLVVLDMQMPLRADATDVGNDAVIRFLLDYHLAKCQIVVFTGSATYEGCVQAVKAGAAAYLPKRTGDADGGAEACLQQLVATCRSLLRKGNANEPPAPPDGKWFDENWERLCQEYGGRWIAFLSPSEAMAAGFEGTEWAGCFVVTHTDRDCLVQLISEKLVHFGAIPPIAVV